MNKTHDELCDQIALLEEQCQELARRNARLLAERDQTIMRIEQAEAQGGKAMVIPGRQ